MSNNNLIVEDSDREHVSVPSSKTKAVKGPISRHLNTDTISKLGQSGATVVVKGAQASGAGSGIPEAPKHSVKMGKELKKAHSNRMRIEDGKADPTGGHRG